MTTRCRLSRSALLIEPYGIEIQRIATIPMEGKQLLIEPYGIEIRELRLGGQRV